MLIMQNERDVWNTTSFHRAIREKIGKALSAHYDLSEPLPERPISRCLKWFGWLFEDCRSRIVGLGRPHTVASMSLARGSAHLESVAPRISRWTKETLQLTGETRAIPVGRPMIDSTPPKASEWVRRKDSSLGPQDHFSRSTAQGAQEPWRSYPVAREPLRPLLALQGRPRSE